MVGPSPPWVGVFYDNFECVARGFVRRARALERERFEVMTLVYPNVREWAIEKDKEDPEANRLAKFEALIRCARNIVDVPQGAEPGAAVVLDDPMMQNWVLGNASTERSDFAREVYRRCLDRLADAEPELASKMRAAHELETGR